MNERTWGDFWGELSAKASTQHREAQRATELIKQFKGSRFLGYDDFGRFRAKVKLNKYESVVVIAASVDELIEKARSALKEEAELSAVEGVLPFGGGA